MAERYGNSEINSGKDISEIKSTLNDLATRLERTQLRAVTPERKTVQFNTTKQLSLIPEMLRRWGLHVILTLLQANA